VKKDKVTGRKHIAFGPIYNMSRGILSILFVAKKIFMKKLLENVEQGGLYCMPRITTFDS